MSSNTLERHVASRYCYRRGCRLKCCIEARRAYEREMYARTRDGDYRQATNRMGVLPVDPLIAELDRRGISLRSLGVNMERTIHRSAGRGLSIRIGDEVACLLGLHPSDLWGSAWWDA